MPQRKPFTSLIEFTTFGSLLKYLRRRAQLTQTELATACGYNPSQISRLEKNQRVPDRATLLALFVPALDLEAEPELVERLLQLAASARGGQAMIDVPHPNSTQPKPLKNNLPAQVTPFIGRALELDALALLLKSPDVRLVTILGAGGMGKTRLSIEAALGRNKDFADGVFFVPLASVSTSEYLITAIAEAVKCKFYPGRTPRETLLEYLHEASMLLVLDNFEHLLAGVDLISDILQSAPGLKILVTSRERLSLHAETLYRLEGMDFPDEESLGRSADFSAARLFVQAARRVQPSFSLDEGSQAAVVQICQQVSGMPLAIELAAAWVDTLSVEEISQEIERSLDFLKTGAQDLPLRQRSIQTVFDSSWQRLTPEECRICLWLSVFRGGFTRQAAQQVTGASIETLNSLLNKSLLRRETSGRFDVHELLRQYSETKLETLPIEAHQARGAHALYYTQFMEEHWTLLQSPDARTAAEAIETEMGNIRAAWQFLIADRQSREVRKFIRVFWIFFDQKNRFDEGITLLEESVNAFSHVPADDELEETIGLALTVQGNLYTMNGFPQRSVPLIARGLDLLQKQGNPADVFIALVALWLTNSFLDNVETYKNIAQEAVSTAQIVEESRILAGALFMLGLSYLRLDEYQEAHRIGAEALKYAMESRDPFTLGLCFGLLLARTARDMGNFETAKQYYLQGIEYFEAADRTYYVCMASNEVVLALVASGDLEAAGRFLYKAMNFFVKNRIGYQIIATVISAATLIAAQGQFEDSVKLLALAITHPAGFQDDRKRAQILLADVQTKLHPDVFAVAYEHGKTLHLETAAAGLLQELQSEYSLS